jgi:hypothetical protein
MLREIYSKTILLMKAGPHSGYDLDEIFTMKKKEERLHGKFFWGYAGTLCHPIKIRSFVKKSLRDYNKTPALVLMTTSSKYFSNSPIIKEYSVDGKYYYPIPDGIILTGCTFVIIGKDLKKVNINIDLNKYYVADGKNRGKPLGECIRYHVNKGCAILSPHSITSTAPKYGRISYIAQLAEPYCAFVR